MIRPSILADIKGYCDANGINNIEDLINKMLLKGFTIEKYGETPSKHKKVIETIKEVPIEIIKEVYVTDDKTIEDLSNKVNKLTDELIEKSDKHFADVLQLTEELKSKDSVILELKNELQKVKKRDMYDE